MSKKKIYSVKAKWDSLKKSCIKKILIINWNWTALIGVPWHMTKDEFIVSPKNSPRLGRIALNTNTGIIVKWLPEILPEYRCYIE